MIILYLLYAIGGFLAVLFLRKNRFTFYTLAERSVGLLNDLMTAEDDDKKLEMLTGSTNKLVASLGKGMLLIAVAVLIFIVPSSTYIYINEGELFSPELGSGYGILALSIGASIPFFLRGKRSPSGYSELAMLLHRMVLNNYTIGLRLLKREKSQAKKNGIVTDERFVIVSGLARAGTTSLLNNLMETNQFASLNYANMPFLLSPNSWARVYRPKTEQLKERSHKDGIKIGLESNEALEEYFFKAELNDSFIAETELSKHEVIPEIYQNYLDYQSVVRMNQPGTYLAKNNNFILRYESVRAQNESFLFVVLYRNPLYHAASLLEKHLQYSEMQNEDPFVLEYMDWLGHHEFGLNQKPFVFNANQIPAGNKAELDYWLKVWINYYSYAKTLKHNNTLFLSYEAYCENPVDTMNVVLEKASMNSTNLEKAAFTNSRDVSYTYSEELLAEAMEIYRSFKA